MTIYRSIAAGDDLLELRIVLAAGDRVFVSDDHVSIKHCSVEVNRQVMLLQKDIEDIQYISSMRIQIDTIDIYL